MNVAPISLATENELAALRKLAESLPNIPEVVRIVVFGSRVRGDFRASSDMDVMVVVSSMTAEVRNNLIRILHDTELEYDVPLSPVIFTEKEYGVNKNWGSRFIEKIENEGIILYDSEDEREA